MCSGVSVADNLVQADGLIRAAAADGATFVATPEMTHLMQRSPKRLFATITTEDKDAGLIHFQALARELDIHILIGSLAVLGDKDKALNRSFLIGPDGQIIARYDKIHLFDVTLSRAETYKESNVYDGGTQAVTATIGHAKLGLSICYDVRFAALYRAYGQADAHILTVPAAFTVPTGRAHWETLLRARAVETGSFVIAPAQGGSHEDGRNTWGHSMIIGPWGDVRAVLGGDAPGYICAYINLDDVTDARRKVPAWQHNPNFDTDGL